jgi:hypothetical protein
MKKIKFLLPLLAAGTLLVSCPDTDSTVTVPVDELTRNGYVRLIASREKGRYGPVIVFAERHNSRLVQAEIAYCLDLLAEQNGLDQIALEGMFGGEDLDRAVVPDVPASDKTGILLGFLENGEIKAPEFMRLAKALHIYGIESREEYEVVPSNSAAFAFTQYLFFHVIISVQDTMPGVLKDVLNESRNSETQEQAASAFEKLLSMDPWTRETFDITQHDVSLAAPRLRELVKKCDPYLDDYFRDDQETLGLIKAGMREYIHYIETTQKRGFTMAAAVLDALKKDNRINAMIIGAAHVKDIENRFTRANIRYYIFEPNGVKEDYPSDLSGREYARRLEQQPLYSGEVFNRFLGSGRNPQPIIIQNWYTREFAMAALMLRVIRAATSMPPREPPFGLSPADLRLEGLAVSSINRVGEHVGMNITNGDEQIYVLVLDDLSYDFEGVTILESLSAMISRLSRSDYQSTQTDTGEVVVGNFLGRLVYMGTDYETVTNAAAMTIRS